MENWKDVRGFEGQYLVSDHGRVMSVYRQWRTKNDQLQMQRTLLMKCSADPNGYRLVKLVSTDGAVRVAGVQVLVAERFCEPYRGEVVNHIDGNPGNNHFKNLEWCSQSANVFHGYLRKKLVRLTGREIDELKGIYGTVPVTILAERYNIDVKTVYNIALGGRKGRKRQ